MIRQEQGQLLCKVREAGAIVVVRVRRVIVDIAIEDSSIVTIVVIASDIREIRIRRVVVDIPIVGPQKPKKTKRTKSALCPVA